MKKVNVSTKKMSQFAGKWVAIDPVKNKIVAVGETLADIGPLVTHRVGKKTDPHGPYAFKVPRPDEGPYVLCHS